MRRALKRIERVGIATLQRLDKTGRKRSPDLLSRSQIERMILSDGPVRLTGRRAPGLLSQGQIDQMLTSDGPAKLPRRKASAPLSARQIEELLA